MSEPKHSPLPWNVVLLDGVYSVGDDEENEVCVLGPHEDDARLIVRAVNSFDELREALKAMIDMTYCIERLSGGHKAHRSTFIKAQQALKNSDL